MRVAGRIEGAQQFGLTLKLELEARLCADIQAQFADMFLALDKRFDLQLASCRSVCSDTVALAPHATHVVRAGRSSSWAAGIGDRQLVQTP